MKFYSLVGCDYDRYSHDPEQFWDCLRNKTAPQIVSAQYAAQMDPADEVDHFWNIFLPWTPTAGTDLYATQPFWEFQKGNYIDIPWIIGTVKNEATIFVGPPPTSLCLARNLFSSSQVPHKKNHKRYGNPSQMV